MAGRRFLVGLAVLTGCCFITANVQAGLVDSNTAYGQVQAWDGFDAEFSPQWEGETTAVDTWQAPEISDIYTSGTGCYMSSGTMATVDWGRWGSGILSVGSDPYDPGRWATRPTVRKISSSSDSKVLNSTWLRYAGQEYTTTKNDSSGAEMARYATLMSPQDDLLANATAIAYKNASFGGDEFSADGRVSATAILDYDVKEATANSTGKSWLKAKYELDRDTDFSLDLDLAILGQIDFSFTATDVNSGEVAFNFDTVPNGISIGIQQEFSMDGTLEAGTYEFALNCLTDAAVNSQGQWNPGGQAEFDLSLDLKEEYVQVWVPGDDFRTASDIVALLAKYFDLPHSLVAGLDTDDIASLLDEYFDSTGITVAGSNSSSNYPVSVGAEGDFNRDGVVNGEDVTIMAANWVNSTSSAAAVPEPSTLSMLICGGLGCLIAGLRRRNAA